MDAFVKMILDNNINFIPKYASGVQEWAIRGENIFQGCGHGCKYCYAMGMNVAKGKQKNKETDRMTILKGDVIQKCKFHGRFSRKVRWDIMHPSMHDIFYSHIDAHIDLLKRSLDNGNRVLIVSKPKIRCIRAICEALKDYDRNQFMFRFSIGSADNSVLKMWEPGAPSLNHRLKCLEFANKEGFQTSVSMEPLLNDDAEELVDLVRENVTDAIWIGTMNKPRSNVSLVDGTDSEMHHEVNLLLDKVNDEYLWGLYETYKNDQMIKWKESLKKLFGLKRHTIEGLDI